MEIGSEFWKSEKDFFDNNVRYYLAGRTALDAIIKEIKIEHKISSALLPSYCCDTMIEPFISNNISVRFYDVYVDNYNKITFEIPKPKNNELLYIMKYFGNTYSHYSYSSYVQNDKDITYWEVSVEDMTHSCFCDFFSYADYKFASYRKWFPVSAISTAFKQNNKWKTEEPTNLFYNFEELRNKAFLLKSEFIGHSAIDKEAFLSIFLEAEKLLNSNYKNYRANDNSISTLYNYKNKAGNIRKKRRSNAKYLYEKLKSISQIKTINFPEKNDDCPMFVPIIVNSSIRDSLKNFLISKQVYCPIHWPLSKYHKGITEKAKEIYNTEISLICDQRYDLKDMNEIVNYIYYYFKELI